MKILYATVLGFSIAVVSHSSPAQEIYGSPDAPLVAEVLDTQVHTDDPDEMQYLILSKLVDRYATDQNIEIEPAEIDAYVESVNQAMQEDRRQWEKRRDELTGKLSSADLPDSERQAQEKELATLNELLANPSGGGDETTEETAEEQAARREIAAVFIRQWKINRALYQQYGGRIVYQQGGPEPLDAYRRFLEEQAGAGAFRILDETFEPALWKYYTTDSLHSFYPAGSEEEARAFEQPPW